ncbi:MAG: hypothetical protein IKO05_10175 [Selenomonadaceae bacterium]|nr:hypothetical protein [Selenomonadaceae bacterium]
MSEFVFDLQRFSNLDTLKNLGGIITTLGLKKLAKDFEKAKDDPVKWLKTNTNPILRIIGITPFGKKISKYSVIITSSISVIDNALSVLTDKTLPDATRNKKIGLIAADLEKMANATNKLSTSFKKKNLWFLSIFSGGISLAANLIAASDGVTLEEKKSINKSYVIFLKSLGSDLVKEIFSSAVEKQLSRAFKEELTSDLVEEIMTKGKFFQAASETLTKTFGAVLSLATGTLNAIDEHKARMEKYTTDGIPEDIAKHDAFIDAFATFVHDNLSSFAKGFDDWVFNFIMDFAGKETDKNYVEVIADKFKTLNGENSGTSDDDPIISVKNKSYIYGDNGNDSIENVASDVSIWGGHDNDTIWSIDTESKTPVRNSILGGPGDDFIGIQDKNSTIYGGAGSDSLVAQGTKNFLYGGSGDDYIILTDGANSNTVSGDLGNDLIFIDSAKNNKFRYSTGDGNDSIWGFGANDSLIIDGKFSTTKSGSDIKVKVGNGSILLLGAADKKIHINNNVLNETPEGSETFTPIPYPTLPAVPELNLVNGTSGNDTIKNYRSNVLINAGAGNDSIDSYRHWDGSKYTTTADNVTINSGAGNDDIYNSGDNVTIDGGKGDDDINNNGDNVTINGGDGDDTIDNYNYASDLSISGGAGNDSIFNKNGGNVSIDGSAGNDYIYSNGSNVTINAGAGDDYIYNRYDYHASINAGDGNDSIENNGCELIIDAGDGNDSIYNYGGDFVTINGGAGNDTIFNDDKGSSVTLDAGTGNDLISISSDSYYIVIQYTPDDGNDIIYGFNGDDTLQIGGGTGSYFSKTSGNDLIVTVGKGKITLVGAAKLKTLNIYGVYKDPTLLTVTNKTPSPVTLDLKVKTVDASARTKAIQITGNAKANSIVGGSKGDTLDGGQGHDTIVGGSGSDKIYGGSGNDCIIGGAGNDSLWGDAGADKFFYALGDGKDIIFGFDDKDTLTLDGLDFKASYKNEILTLKVDGGSVTLKDFSAKTFHINDGVYKLSGSKLVKK